MNYVKDITSGSTNIVQIIYSKITINNIIKYIVQGIAVAIASFVLTNKTKSLHQVMIISALVASTFFVLDIFTDEIASGSRYGIGFAIGLSLINNTPNSFLGIL